jgi:hypothetical protein
VRDLLLGNGMDMHGHPGNEPWLCAHCGEPVGAYEPMVTVENGRARRTSRTAELRAGRLASEHRYHQACYVIEDAEPPAE